METNKVWKLNLIDLKDGSENVFVELPDDLLAVVGWVEGQLLEIDQVGQSIVIKTDFNGEKRNESH